MRPDSLPRLWRYINLLLTYIFQSKNCHRESHMVYICPDVWTLMEWLLKAVKVTLPHYKWFDVNSLLLSLMQYWWVHWSIYFTLNFDVAWVWYVFLSILLVLENCNFRSLKSPWILSFQFAMNHESVRTHDESCYKTLERDWFCLLSLPPDHEWPSLIMSCFQLKESVVKAAVYNVCQCTAAATRTLQHFQTRPAVPQTSLLFWHNER